MRYLNNLIFLLWIFISILAGQQKHYKIKVEGKVPKADLVESTKTFYIITAEDIKKLPFNNLSELLASIPFITTLRRSPISYDIGIRGSSPKRVLVLLNGIRINDPQTEHFNFVLPISLNDVDRIEIIKGGTSTFYGSSAFAGVINIVTKTKGLNSLNMFLGEKGTISAHLNKTFKKFNFSLSSTKSDGYYEGQEFDITNFNAKFHKGRISFFAGGSWRNLGEKGFYAPYPSIENIKNFILSTETRNEEYEVSFLARMLTDHFILDRNNPSWYENKHNNYLYSLKAAKNIFLNQSWDIKAGTEINFESIESKRLGNHERASFAFSLITRKIGEKSIFESGIRYENYSNTGSFTNYYFGYELIILPKLTVSFSFGNSIRLPNFTELCYESPANIGNPELSPEESINFDVNLSYNSSWFSFYSSLYLRHEKNIIDWVRSDPYSAWKATNLPEFNIYGVEAQMTVKNETLFLGLGMMANLSNTTIKQQTKYAFAFEKEKFSVFFSYHFKKFSFGSSIYYKKMYEGDSGIFIDGKISFKIAKKVSLFVRGNNLLNTVIEEIPNIKIPGRWIFAGINLNF